MEKSVEQTCGSVRSSLSAPAQLVMVGSEAAETEELRLRARKRPRGSFRSCQHHGGLRAGLSDMSNGSELPQAPSKSNEPKMLTGSSQTVMQSDAPPVCMGHTDKQTAGVKVGTNSLMLVERNTVNLTSRPVGVGRAARFAEGMPGRGSWNKRMPSGNRADRSCNITPLRKQADFQQVGRHETAVRTFMGGNRK
jgi:hypothetical protein